MKYAPRVLIISILVLVVIGWMVSGTDLVKRGMPHSTSSSSQAVSPSPSSSDEASSTKPYVSRTFSFAVRYPSSMRAFEATDGVTFVDGGEGPWMYSIEVTSTHATSTSAWMASQIRTKKEPLLKLLKWIDVPPYRFAEYVQDDVVDGDTHGPIYGQFVKYALVRDGYRYIIFSRFYSGKSDPPRDDPDFLAIVNSFNTAGTVIERRADPNHRFGFIKSLTTVNDVATIELDDAEWMTTPESQLIAAFEDGKCTAKQLESPQSCLNNPFYIRNNSTSTEQIPVAASAVTSIKAVLDPMNSNMVPYWVTVKNGKAIKVEKQYVP